MPGFGNMDPKKLQGMMSKLGIKQEEIEAKRVIIEQDSGNIVIENPQVLKTEMQGQTTWQVSGDVVEEPDFSQDDIMMIMEKTGKSEDEVRIALEETGDIAEAILKLQ